MRQILKVMKVFWRAGAGSALAYVLAACLLFPQLASAAVLADGDYLIQMADSDLAAVSSGSTMIERVRVGQNMPSGVWRFEHLGNNYYKIIAPKRVMVLDSAEGKKYKVLPGFPWVAPVRNWPGRGPDHHRRSRWLS